MSYLPLDRDILTSSLWAQGSPEAVKVWIYLLVAANPRSGVVADADPAIALRCALSLEATTAALGWLASPDPYSRTRERAGRRIARLEEGGIRILNYEKYRDKDHSTPRVRRFRERLAPKDETGCNGVTPLHVTVGNDGQEQEHGNEQTDPPPTPSGGGGPAAAKKNGHGRRSRLPGDAAKLATVDTLETRAIIAARYEILGGDPDPTLPKLEAASRALEARFTVEKIRRAFEVIRDAPEGGPGLASFCRARNNAFEYSVRPSTLQKILDEGAAAANGPRDPREEVPFGALSFDEQDRRRATETGGRS